MIRIYKDKDVKVVTRGAYEQFYKPLGYNIIFDVVHDEQVEDNNKNKNTDKAKRSSSSDKKNKIKVSE